MDSGLAALLAAVGDVVASCMSLRRSAKGRCGAGGRAGECVRNRSTENRTTAPWDITARRKIQAAMRVR